MGSLRTGLWLAPECLWNCCQSRCHKLQTCWNRREPEAGLLELISSPYLQEISRVLPVKDISTNKEKDLLQCGRGNLRESREDQGHFWLQHSVSTTFNSFGSVSNAEPNSKVKVIISADLPAWNTLSSSAKWDNFYLRRLCCGTLSILHSSFLRGGT